MDREVFLVYSSVRSCVKCSVRELVPSEWYVAHFAATIGTAPLSGGLTVLNIIQGQIDVTLDD
jgi:hypothetical protein